MCKEDQIELPNILTYNNDSGKLAPLYSIHGIINIVQIV
jgi:hypothetical protein